MATEAETTAEPENKGWGAQSVTVDVPVEKHSPGQSYALDEIQAKLRAGAQMKSLDRSLSRAELARRLNVSTATLNRWQKAEKDGTLDKPKPRGRRRLRLPPRQG
jgi:ribosome-binding protein aMBF1 (putative translation factor)